MRRLALLTLAMGWLAACGGDDGKRSASRRSATVPARTPVRVDASEYSFDPARIVVTGGGRTAVPVTFVLHNRGTLAHDLRVLRNGSDLGGTPIFQGGRSESGTVRLPRGRYDFVCTVGDHAQLGMRGALEVR